MQYLRLNFLVVCLVCKKYIDWLLFSECKYYVLLNSAHWNICLVINNDQHKLDFHESIRVVPLKDLMYFLAGIVLNNSEIFLKKNILLQYIIFRQNI